MSYCTQHPGKEAVGSCCECGHLVCKACYTELNDKVYCSSCANKLFTMREQEAPKVVTPPPPAPQKPQQVETPMPVEPVKQAIQPEPPKPAEPVKQAALPRQDVIIVPPPPAVQEKPAVAATPQIAKEPAPEVRKDATPPAPDKIKPAQPATAGSKSMGFLWWLAPVFLAFIGGLLAWFMTKAREPGKAKIMLFTGIGLTVVYALAIVIFAVLPGISVSQSSKGTIIYSSDGDKSWQIWVINPSGSDADQFSISDNVSKYFNAQQSWSPAAKKMAFCSSRDGNNEVYTIDADGSNEINITNNNYADIVPDWSPDGKKIAFVSNRDGNDEIYVMNPDGSDVKRLTNSKPADAKPRWSPGSDKILFSTERDGNWEIYVMDADGSNQRRLTTNEAWEGQGRWSPDGKTIVFSSNRDGNPEIYTMDADGNNQKRVTFNSANDYGPCFSPDGTKIVYYFNTDKTDELYIMNLDGGNQVRLTKTKVNNQNPQWISEKLKAPAVLEVPPLRSSPIGSDVSAANKNPSGEDYVHYVKYIADDSGSVDMIKVYSTKAGNVKAAVYSHNNKDDVPLEKLSSNDQPTACAANQWNNIPIPPVTLTKGSSYWLAFDSDTTGIVMNGTGQQKLMYGKAVFEDFTFPANPPSGMAAGSKYDVSISCWGMGQSQSSGDTKPTVKDK
jgi:hypothetical protein